MARQPDRDQEGRLSSDLFSGLCKPWVFYTWTRVITQSSSCKVLAKTKRRRRVLPAASDARRACDAPQPVPEPRLALHVLQGNLGSNLIRGKIRAVYAQRKGGECHLFSRSRFSLVKTFLVGGYDGPSYNSVKSSLSSKSHQAENCVLGNCYLHKMPFCFLIFYPCGFCGIRKCFVVKS